MKPATLARLCCAPLFASAACAAAEPGPAPRSAAAPSALAARSTQEVRPAATAPRPALLDKVVVVGASLSDGFGLRNELKVDATFADVLAAACRSDVEITAHTDSLFYMDPVPRGGALLERALAEGPSLLVALDFPFWYVHDYRFMYGGYDERVQGLDLALELLAGYDGPLVLGDLPDVSVSLEGVGPLGTPMIPAPAIPDERTLARLNERLRAWAAERPQVVLVSIGDFLGKVVAGEPLSVRELAVAPDSLNVMLQEDLLHPTLAGECALAVVVLDALARAHPEIEGREPALFSWSADEIRAELWERTAEARAEALERERKREERRRKREERRSAEEAGEQSARAAGPARAAA